MTKSIAVISYTVISQVFQIFLCVWALCSQTFDANFVRIYLKSHNDKGMQII